MRLCSTAFVLAAAAIAFSTCPASARHAYFGFGLCQLEKSDEHSLDKAIKRCAYNLINTNNTEDKASDYYALAQLYQLNRQYDLAVANYTNAIGWWHAAGEPYWARGDSYTALGKADLAKADYDVAAKIDAGKPNATSELCWARAIRGGPLDLGMENCNQVLAAKPNDATALFARCLLHIRLGEAKAAVGDCDAANGLDPKMAGALYARGIAKGRNGDAAGSSDDIAAAKLEVPEVAEDYKVLGIQP